MRSLALFALTLGCRYAPEAGVADPGDGAQPPDSGDAPPDTVTLAPCPAAPAGCTLFECAAATTSCYYACAPRSWTGARDQCVTDQRGCLATINSADENACLFANTAPIVFPDLVFFGFHQAADQPTPDDGWSWQCGSSTFAAGNWGDFEPNDNDNQNDESNRENCGALGDGGAWIDIGCDDDRRYVCELPREPA